MSDLRLRQWARRNSGADRDGRVGLSGIGAPSGRHPRRSHAAVSGYPPKGRRVDRTRGVRRARGGHAGPAQVRGELHPVLVRRGHGQGVLSRRGAEQGSGRRGPPRGPRAHGGRDHRGQGRRLIAPLPRSWMRCPQCQHDNLPGARFCNTCGTGLAGICQACGQVNPPASRYCSACGQRLTIPGTIAAPTRYDSPGAYTPPHLAQRILASRETLEGERKQVTVLFADTKGSMELLADRDPEDARRLLDAVLERMIEAVHHYEGTVNQVMGDGIMALFGAPIAHEEHAVRACYAALRMQQRVGEYAQEVHRTLGVPVHIRVGLNSGEVVVRSIGSDLKMDYTAIGQTTHLAARMEQMAMPGTILFPSEPLGLVE